MLIKITSKNRPFCDVVLFLYKIMEKRICELKINQIKQTQIIYYDIRGIYDRIVEVVYDQNI